MKVYLKQTCIGDNQKVFTPGWYEETELPTIAYEYRMVEKPKEVEVVVKPEAKKLVVKAARIKLSPNPKKENEDKE